MSAIAVTDSLFIEEKELALSFIRASGPGGQNVNKVSTAVQLRFDARRSPSLPDEVRARLETLAGSRLTLDGVIVITAARFRSQERNRADALDRLLRLLARAAVRRAKRRPTRPSRAAREERLKAKARRSSVKVRRTRPAAEE
ncbi:MAG: alternative ribosome rescue aminoacyl-tRNA hydrolase ArfB [Caulobacteraceae bacterium]